MFKQAWTIGIKELRLWLQKPGQVVMIFLVPLAFIWIMGLVFGRETPPRVAIFAVNEDLGTSGALVLQQLTAASSLEVEVLPTRAQADQKVGAGERIAALVIPAHFSAAMLSSEGAQIEMIVDPAKNEKASIVSGLANQALSSILINAEVERGINQGLGDSLNNMGLQGDAQQQDLIRKFITAGIKGIAASQVQEALNDPLIRVTLTSASGNPSRRPPTLLEHMTPGYALMYVFFLVTNLALTILEERQSGTLRRLLTTPVSRAAILLGKIWPFWLVAVVQMAFVFTFSSLVFGLNLGSNLLALLAMMMVTAAVVVSFGIFVAAMARTEGQVGGTVTLLVLLMAVVSGSMFPEIRVPYLEYATPHYWSILGFQNVITRGAGLEGIWLPGGILLALALAFFFIGVRRFRFE